jgi:hypothetical protein
MRENREELDLKSHGVFVDACRLAGYPGQTHTEVNLRKTRHIRASGMAILLMLRAQTDWERNRIRPVSCGPEIRPAPPEADLFRAPSAVKQGQSARSVST